MLKKRLLSILFWSVVSAAFIGPGTVTTATKAGVFFNFQLLWALVFSTFAALLLQEASARLTINSQLNLGEAIAKKFEGSTNRTFVLFFVVIAIFLGCAAYEAGNILGAVQGLKMMFHIPNYFFVGAIGLLAIIVFFVGSVHSIARFMGLIVFLMGGAFIFTSISLKPDWGQVIHGSFVPVIPSGTNSAILIMALIGTTVIPYDLFLGSGALNKKQSLQDMRFGLSIAIILGGIISMAIMGVGNAVTESMSEQEKANFISTISFDRDGNGYVLLTEHLRNKIGIFAVYVFGIGMFAAGFSSAVTSPLASAITAKSLFETKENKKRWHQNKFYFKSIILAILSVGLMFGFLDIEPIPAIILAQAFNGLILPMIAIFLIYVVNDPEIIGEEHLNGWISNILIGIVLWGTMLIGFTNIITSVAKTLNFDVADNQNNIMLAMILISFIITAFILWKIYRKRIKLVEHRL
jgi:NRAMP (natural resistance-associated macrophage protein)-like metal ion transporter